MKLVSHMDRLYRTAFLADNRIRRYHAPQTFWQKIAFAIIQDKYTVVVPARKKVQEKTAVEGQGEAKSVIEIPVRIPLHSVIRTKSAVSTLLTEEMIR